MAYTVELYLDSAWRSVEAQVPLIVNETLHNNLVSSSSSCRFNIRPSSTILNYLLGLGNTDADVRIKEDSTVIFQGLLRKSFTIKKKNQRQDLYTLEAVGYSYKLERRLNEDKQYTSQTVTAIVEDLLTDLGINYSMPTITTVINSLYLKRGDNYKVIESLLKEYGHIFYVDNQGTARTVEIAPASISTVETFDDTNTLDSIDLMKKEQEKERIEVDYRQQKTATSGIVFSDTTNAQGVYKCYIQLAAGAYLGGQQYIYADLFYNKNKIVSLASHTLDINADTGITVATNTLEGNRVKLSIQNTSGVTKNIYKLDIIGNTIVYEEAAGREIATNNASTYKIESVSAKYIFSNTIAQAYAQKLLNYYIYSDFTYSLTSKTNVALGAQVLLDHDGIGSINARVTGKMKDYQSGLTQYKLEGITEYSAETSVSEPAYTAPDPLNNQAIILTYPEQPTNNVTDVTADFTENADGTANVVVEFSYTQGEKPATQFLCYVLRSFSTPGVIDYYTDQAVVKPYTADGDYAIPFSLPTRAGSAPIHYKIGVVAANGSKLHADGAVIPTGWSDKTLTGALQYDGNNYWDLDSGEMRIGSNGSYILITPDEGVNIVNLNLNLEKTSISVEGTYNTRINDSGVQVYDEFIRSSLPAFYKSYNTASFVEYDKSDGCYYYPIGFYNDKFYCTKWNSSTDIYYLVNIDLSGNVTNVYTFDNYYIGLFISDGIVYIKKQVSPYNETFIYNINGNTFSQYCTLPDGTINPLSTGNTVYLIQEESICYIKLYNFKQNTSETLFEIGDTVHSISNIIGNIFIYIIKTGTNIGDIYKYNVDTKENILIYEDAQVNNNSLGYSSIFIDNKYFIYTHGSSTYALSILDINGASIRTYNSSYPLLLQRQKTYTTDSIYVGDSTSNFYLVNNVTSGTISLTSCTTTGYNGLIDGKYAFLRRFSSASGKFSVGVLPVAKPTSELGAGIIEEGTNSNGSYIKYSNGTMVCYGSKSVSLSMSIANYAVGNYGWSFYYLPFTAGAVIDFPASFLSSSDYQFVANDNGGSLSLPYHKNDTASRVKFGFMNAHGYEATFSWHAIGRWK